MGLPPTVMSATLNDGKAFHTAAIDRAFPQFATLPSEDKKAPPTCARAHNARFANEAARFLLAHAGVRTRVLDRATVLPRALLAVARPAFGATRPWFPLLTLYLHAVGPGGVRPYTGDCRGVCLPACGFSRMRQMRDITVVIVTHNRAGMLQQTLACLAGLSYAARWQALVVDNGCTDDTPNVVRAARRHFPVHLRYPCSSHSLASTAHGTRPSPPSTRPYRRHRRRCATGTRLAVPGHGGVRTVSL